jgi:small-conductance mechanosensitive channel
MAFERNVGGTDRIARAVGGVGLLVVTLVAVLAGWLALATGAALASSGLLFNAVVGWCGMNALFGVNTCSRE